MPQPPERRGLHRGLTLARVVGVAATAALLGVGAQIALMVAPSDEPEVPATVAATATPSPAPEKGRPRTKGKPRLSARARAARRAAAAAVSAQGYTPVSLATWDPSRDLRVLIGTPAGRSDAGRRAFFFRGRSFVGTDTMVDSARIKVLDRGAAHRVTLQYRLYASNDRPCCPSGDAARVRFEWTGEIVQPIDPMPDPDSRIFRG